MESSRIFIKNLPPTLSEDDLRKHFSSKGDITSLKIIPKRRIAFIGYKDPAVAAKASKFYNRTYIRLSKLSVELAQPLASLHSSSATATESAVETSGATPNRRVGEPAISKSDAQDATTSLKRKRDVAAAPSHAKPFLPGGGQRDQDSEPPAKIQALEDEDSDAEYQDARPDPSVKALHSSAKVKSGDGNREGEEDIIKAAPLVPGPPATTNVSNDDWLRARTNRLLDLVDSDEMRIETNAATTASATAIPATTSVSPDTNTSYLPKSADDEMEKERVEGVNTPQGQAGLEADGGPLLDPVVEKIKETSRLYIRNLPYTATDTDLRQRFETFGELEEVHLCVDKAGKSKGFAFLHFSDPPCAVDAFQQTDGADFQGRILHVLAGDAKRGGQLDEFSLAKLPLKQQNLIQQKSKSVSAFRWNELYMSQDAVNMSMAARKGISKADLLDHTSSDTAVKQAIAETEVIRDAKAYFVQNGVDLDAFKSKDRGDGTAILVKNFPHGTTVDELRAIYEPHGEIRRVLIPPTGTIAIVEFAHASQAKVAYMKTGYQKFKDSLLFLEKAPKNLFKEPPKEELQNVVQATIAIPSLSVAELLATSEEGPEVETSSLFVKNLNFNTGAEALETVFRSLDGFMSAKVKTKADPKNANGVLSMGFGFVEFRSKELAQQAIKHTNGFILDGHKLSVRSSHRGQDAAEVRKRQDEADIKSMIGRKIIVKNLPFQTTKKDLRALIETYGRVRSLRLPKNFESRARGFAFVEFATPVEALHAFETLKDTHFLGRKLVLEWAAAEPVDNDEVISKMQQKAGKQLNKVALQELKGGGGRQRFDVEGSDEAEDG